jgi:hypothetical protein
MSSSTSTPSVPASAVPTGKRPSATKISAQLSKVREIRVLDTDLVLTMDTGETAVVPDGAIRSMTDPAFVLQFDDSEVAGSALLRQAGRMEIGDLSSVAVSTPARQDDPLWLKGSTARAGVADSATGAESAAPTGAHAAAAPATKSWAEQWTPWASLAGAFGGVAIAAAGKGSGSGAASVSPATSTATSTPQPAPEPFVLFGSVTGGPVVAGNDLRVEVRDAAGKLLGSGLVDASGRYQITGLSGAYRGALLVSVGSDGTAPDYRDEATGAPVNLGTPWRAVVSRDGETLVKANITPLTELVVQGLDLSDGKSLPAPAVLTSANAALAKLLGLGDTDLTQLTPQATIDANGGTTSANDYGRLLAILSGLDIVAGTTGGGALALLAPFIDRSGATPIWKATADDGATLADRLTQAFNALSANDRSAATLALMNKSFGLPAGAAPHLTDVAISAVDAQGAAKQDSLGAGDRVRVVLAADARLCVVGDTTLDLQLGERSVQARFVGTTSDGALVFEYAVAKEDFAAPGEIRVTGIKSTNGGGFATAAGTAASQDLPTSEGSAGITIGVPIGAADWSLVGADDTGRDAADRVTQKTTLRLEVTGQAGRTVHLFEDLNGNGVVDLGEEIGSTVIRNGRTTGVISVALDPGRHALGVFQSDSDERTGPTSSLKDLLVDNTTDTPQVRLAGLRATASDGTPLALESSPTLQVSAEVGSDVTLFVDDNGNGRYDASDRVLARYRQTEARQTVQTGLTLSDGKIAIGAIATDAAGNQASATPGTIAIAAQPVTAPKLSLLGEDDTGDSATDGLTQRTAVRIVVSGQADARVVIFDDRNGNGIEDEGERLTTVPPRAGETSQTVSVTLAEGAHQLLGYQIDAYGRKGESSSAMALTVDATAPVAPGIELVSTSDTGVKGDGITAARDIQLQLRGEAGSTYWLYEDANGNGTTEASELRGTGVFDATGMATLDIAVSPGSPRFIALSRDTAGNLGSSTTFDLRVIDGLPPILAPQVLRLEARTMNDADPDDSLLSNGSLYGERLTAAHLGIGDFASPADVTITFAQMVNLALYRDGQILADAEAFTLRELLDGHITLRYNQSAAALQASGAFADAEFTIAHPSATAPTETRYLNLAVQHTQGVVIFGDGSGNGGTTTPLSGALGGSGGAGGGSDDLILGTAQADLIFGDGSGGGGGARAGAGNGAGGTAGAGDDILHGGDGDDVIFGDGFDGDTGLAAGGAGGYGGGGGGGGNTFGGNGSPGTGGVGAGAGGHPLGDGNTVTGDATNLGGVKAGLSGIWTSGRGSGGGGAGVGSGSDYSAEFEGAANPSLNRFDNTGTAKTAIDAARAAVLDGPGDANAENRMFTQRMGAGDDFIDGGAGNDVIMGGLGNDTIIGGTGNDVLYGRGGSARRPDDLDNDTFVWQRHDAGPSGAVDVIRDFGTTEGDQDRLQILNLLEGRTGSETDLSAWIRILDRVQAPAGAAGSDVGAIGTLITIDIDGAGAGRVTQQIFLTGVSLPTTDVNALIAQGIVL